ncbi:hypothetical protein KIPB_006531, partial [Kipferlia bialata]|eukprot:g6531.t1
MRLPVLVVCVLLALCVCQDCLNDDIIDKVNANRRLGWTAGRNARLEGVTRE